MNKIILLVAGFFLMLNAFSQNSISGQILDATNNEPLEYASVALYNLADSLLVTGGRTNPGGNLKIDNVHNIIQLWFTKQMRKASNNN